MAPEAPNKAPPGNDKLVELREFSELAKKLRDVTGIQRGKVILDTKDFRPGSTLTTEDIIDTQGKEGKRDIERGIIAKSPDKTTWNNFVKHDAYNKLLLRARAEKDLGKNREASLLFREITLTMSQGVLIEKLVDNMISITEDYAEQAKNIPEELRNPIHERKTKVLLEKLNTHVPDYSKLLKLQAFLLMDAGANFSDQEKQNIALSVKALRAELPRLGLPVNASIKDIQEKIVEHGRAINDVFVDREEIVISKKDHKYHVNVAHAMYFQALYKNGERLGKEIRDDANTAKDPEKFFAFIENDMEVAKQIQKYVQENMKLNANFLVLSAARMQAGPRVDAKEYRDSKTGEIKKVTPLSESTLPSSKRQLSDDTLGQIDFGFNEQFANQEELAKFLTHVLVDENQRIELKFGLIEDLKLMITNIAQTLDNWWINVGRFIGNVGFLGVEQGTQLIPGDIAGGLKNLTKPSEKFGMYDKVREYRDNLDKAYQSLESIQKKHRKSLKDLQFKILKGVSDLKEFSDMSAEDRVKNREQIIAVSEELQKNYAALAAEEVELDQELTTGLHYFSTRLKESKLADDITLGDMAIYIGTGIGGVATLVALSRLGERYGLGAKSLLGGKYLAQGLSKIPVVGRPLGVFAEFVMDLYNAQTIPYHLVLRGGKLSVVKGVKKIIGKNDPLPVLEPAGPEAKFVVEGSEALKTRTLLAAEEFKTNRQANRILSQCRGGTPQAAENLKRLGESATTNPVLREVAKGNMSVEQGLRLLESQRLEIQQRLMQGMDVGGDALRAEVATNMLGKALSPTQIKAILAAHNPATDAALKALCDKHGLDFRKMTTFSPSEIKALPVLTDDAKNALIQAKNERLLAKKSILQPHFAPDEIIKILDSGISGTTGEKFIAGFAMKAEHLDLLQTARSWKLDRAGTFVECFDEGGKLLGKIPTENVKGWVQQWKSAGGFERALWLGTIGLDVFFAYNNFREFSQLLDQAEKDREAVKKELDQIAVICREQKINFKKIGEDKYVYTDDEGKEIFDVTLAKIDNRIKADAALQHGIADGTAALMLLGMGVKRALGPAGLLLEVVHIAVKGIISAGERAKYFRFLNKCPLWLATMIGTRPLTGETEYGLMDIKLGDKFNRGFKQLADARNELDEVTNGFGSLALAPVMPAFAKLPETTEKELNTLEMRERILFVAWMQMLRAKNPQLHADLFGPIPRPERLQEFFENEFQKVVLPQFQMQVFFSQNRSEPTGPVGVVADVISPQSAVQNITWEDMRRLDFTGKLLGIIVTDKEFEAGLTSSVDAVQANYLLKNRQNLRRDQQILREKEASLERALFALELAGEQAPKSTESEKIEEQLFAVQQEITKIDQQLFTQGFRTVLGKRLQDWDPTKKNEEYPDVEKLLAKAVAFLDKNEEKKAQEMNIRPRSTQIVPDGQKTIQFETPFALGVKDEDYKSGVIAVKGGDRYFDLKGSPFTYRTVFKVDRSGISAEHKLVDLREWGVQFDEKGPSYFALRIGIDNDNTYSSYLLDVTNKDFWIDQREAGKLYLPEPERMLPRVLVLTQRETVSELEWKEYEEVVKTRGILVQKGADLVKATGIMYRLNSRVEASALANKIEKTTMAWKPDMANLEKDIESDIREIMSVLKVPAEIQKELQTLPLEERARNVTNIVASSVQKHYMGLRLGSATIEQYNRRMEQLQMLTVNTFRPSDWFQLASPQSWGHLQKLGSAEAGVEWTKMFREFQPKNPKIVVATNSVEDRHTDMMKMAASLLPEKCESVHISAEGDTLLMTYAYRKQNADLTYVRQVIKKVVVPMNGKVYSTIEVGLPLELYEDPKVGSQAVSSGTFDHFLGQGMSQSAIKAIETTFSATVDFAKRLENEDRWKPYNAITRAFARPGFRMPWKDNISLLYTTDGRLLQLEMAGDRVMRYRVCLDMSGEVNKQTAQELTNRARRQLAAAEKNLASIQSGHLYRKSRAIPVPEARDLLLADAIVGLDSTPSPSILDYGLKTHSLRLVPLPSSSTITQERRQLEQKGDLANLRSELASTAQWLPAPPDFLKKVSEINEETYEGSMILKKTPAYAPDTYLYDSLKLLASMKPKDVPAEEVEKLVQTIMEQLKPEEREQFLAEIQKYGNVKNHTPDQFFALLRVALLPIKNFKSHDPVSEESWARMGAVERGKHIPKADYDRITVAYEAIQKVRER